MAQVTTRRELILRNRESIARATTVAVNLAFDFMADAKEETGTEAENFIGLSHQCTEAAQTLTNILLYAGMTPTDIVDLGISIDREYDLLKSLEG